MAKQDEAGLERWAFGVAGEALANALPRRWSHTRGVAERARQAASLFGPDGDLLVAAALAHDLGYAPDLVDTGFHPLDGARRLRQLGAPERLVHLVAHHTGATVEASQRGLSTQLAEFHDERSALRDALWWADLTTTPDGRRTTMEDRIAEVERRYGADHVVSRSIQLAQPELLGAVRRTQARLAHPPRAASPS
jgi:putative nucleotidyltransferase with HDIG domain